MTLVVGDPALRRLALLKLRGSLRRTWRRLRTPKGAVLTLLGIALFGAWIVGIGASFLFAPPSEPDPELLRPAVRLVASVLFLLGVTSALNHRGLFVPAEEIERLFSAPVTRADLVRYRLTVAIGRGLIGGAILGLLAMRRQPVPAFAFAGVLLGMLTLPIVSQTLAIVSGRLERRWVERTRGLRTVVGLALGALIGFAAFLAFSGGEGTEDLFGFDVPSGGFAGIAAASPLALFTLPFEPWARAITATDAAGFWPWFALCVALWVGFHEGAARLPIDFRELSLETSASVAARIRRARRGAGGAASAQLSKRTRGWRVPWLFGRSPAGAIAWRKTGSILRRARGTVFVSVLVLAFITIVSYAFLEGDSNEHSAFGPAIVAVLGVFYLGAGLRFDFREELDRMETLKSWPLAPRTMFFATILPVVALVSTLLIVAVLVRAAIGGAIHPATWGIVAFLPPLVLAWVGLDNAVFLLSPVRIVPGSEGALQNAGRGMLMLMLRFLLLAAAVALTGGAFFGAWLAGGSLQLSDDVRVVLGGVAAWFALVVLDLVLVWFGGMAYRRFDVATDRP